MVEQLTLNQLVHGSSPCRGTTENIGVFLTFTNNHGLLLNWLTAFLFAGSGTEWNRLEWESSIHVVSNRAERYSRDAPEVEIAMIAFVLACNRVLHM